MNMTPQPFLVVAIAAFAIVQCADHAGAAAPTRVLVWDEQQPQQKEA